MEVSLILLRQRLIHFVSWQKLITNIIDLDTMKSQSKNCDSNWIYVVSHMKDVATKCIKAKPVDILLKFLGQWMAVLIFETTSAYQG